MHSSREIGYFVKTRISLQAVCDTPIARITGQQVPTPSMVRRVKTHRYCIYLVMRRSKRVALSLFSWFSKEKKFPQPIAYEGRVP